MKLPNSVAASGGQWAPRYADQPLPMRTRVVGLAISFAVCAMVGILGLWQSGSQLATVRHSAAITAMSVAPLAAPPSPQTSKPMGEPQEERQAKEAPQPSRTQPNVAPMPPLVNQAFHQVAAAKVPANVPASRIVPTENDGPPSAQLVPSTSRRSVSQQASAPPSNDAPSARTASAEQERWESQLLAALNRVKSYPREAARLRQEGVSWICITMDRRGKVRHARLYKGSGHQALDREALAMATRASPLPRPPATFTMVRIEVTVPISFSIDQA